MSRSWLFLTIPVALAALVLLSRTALSLLRTVRGSVIASVPIRLEQQLTINSSGAFALNVLHVLVLVALGIALIGSLVVTGLVLSGKSFTPASPHNSTSFTPPQ